MNKKPVLTHGRTRPYRRLTSVPTASAVPEPRGSHADPVRTGHVGHPDNSSPARELLEQFDACAARLRIARHAIEEHATFCVRSRLPLDQPLIARLLDAVRHAEARLAQERHLLVGHGGTGRPEQLSAGETVLRFGWATYSYARGALEWCSPSTAQSRAVQFFDVGAQNSAEANYARYESSAVADLERHVADVLVVPPGTHTVSATSSGVAAYTLIEAVLLRHRLCPGDAVLIAPTVHFEQVEQLTALPYFPVLRGSGHGVDDLLDEVRRHRPRCLFVDPLANNARQRMIDVPALIRRLPTVITGPITVVVDGTTLSCGLPAVATTEDDPVEVIYYESGSKHLQLGLDLTMAGFVVHPIGLLAEFTRQRRNTGSILDPRAADLFPRYPSDAHRSRLRRIGDNALRAAILLHDDPRVREVGQVFHPGLPDHPDRAAAQTLPYADGCLSFLFDQPERNGRVELDALFERVLANARTLGVQLAKGASFGFSVPRLWAAEDTCLGVESPFLRLSVGDRADQVDRLVEAVADAVADPIARVLAG
ncbi:PLP-dependent transferase [Actinophytocola sp.]|uniref:PLP-dependent transferase n=1 Tax=Actinophytocola sp. TaxID=1872138 RepID=UPI002ED90AA3